MAQKISYLIFLKFILGIGATIRIGRDIQCLQYAGLFLLQPLLSERIQFSHIFWFFLHYFIIVHNMYCNFRLFKCNLFEPKNWVQNIDHEFEPEVTLYVKQRTCLLYYRLSCFQRGPKNKVAQSPYWSNPRNQELFVYVQFCSLIIIQGPQSDTIWSGSNHQPITNMLKAG